MTHIMTEEERAKEKAFWDNPNVLYELAVPPELVHPAYRHLLSKYSYPPEPEPKPTGKVDCGNVIDLAEVRRERAKSCF